MAVSPLTLLFQAVDNASPVVGNLKNNVKGLFGEVAQLSFYYNQVQQSISSLAAQGQQAYQLLIGQNVELQQQLLSTQSSLAATNKIVANGLEIKDPTAAIKALDAPVKDAVKAIREGSLELVGVTSAQLIPLFQVTAQNSANIGANLKQSADLTLSFAAALGTLGIPLDQARQELTSIYTAQITSDSQLAKSLGLNNQMVNTWKSQGVLVEKLTERLGAFRAGNALAANTIEGVSSNIQEIIDEIGRTAGEPLLQPIVNQLNVVYNFLKDNKDQIQQIAQDTVSFFLEIGAKLGEAVKAVEPVFKTLFEALFTQLSTEANIAASTITLIVDGFIALVQAAAPVLQVIANIVLTLTQLAATDIGQIVLQATLFVGILTQFAPILLAIQAGFTAAAARAILFFAATQGSAAATAALSTIAPVLSGAASAFVAAGGGATGFAAALGATIPSLGAFGAAATAALAPLLPFIALGGAIAVALVVKQTGDLRVANEELEEFRQQNDQLSDESIKLASKLKSLNDVEKANGQLTEEQTKKRTAYQRISQDLVKSLQGQIEAIKQVKPANEEQKRTQEVQIAQLQKQIDLQNKLGGGTSLQSRELTKLGNTYEQLNKKVADAQAQVNSGGGGDTERFKAASDELVKLTQKQLELGQITAADAEARLSKIQSDSRVEFETQIAAQEAITKAKQAEVDKRVKASENEQSKIQALVASGAISETEGQRRTTESKKKQLEIQIQAVAAAIEAENRLRKIQVEGQIANLDKQITETQKKKTEADSKGDKGGARLAQEELDKLNQQKAFAQNSLKIESEKASQLKAQQQKLSTELAQIDQQERQRRKAERLKDFDEQQQILDSRNARKLLSESEYAAQSLKIARDKANAELKQIQDSLNKLAPSDKEGLEALAAKEAQVQQKLAEATEKFESQKSQIKIKSVEDQQKIIDAELAANLISQADYNQKSLELTKQRAEAEIQEISRQRARLPKNDAAGSLALNAKEAEARKAIEVANDKFEQDKSKARIAAIDTEQKILESKLAEGNVTQQQYAQQSLSITQQKLQAELEEINRQRGELKTNDGQKLNELAAQEANIRKRQIDALQKYQEEQIAIIESEQARASQVLEQAEVERLTSITEAEKNRTITRAQAEQQRVNSTRDKINEELNIEKQKLAELEALPPFSNPQREEQRQSQIRASRIKTAQFTKQLIDNEVQQQEAAFRVFEEALNRQTQAQQNAATAGQQAFNQQQTAIEGANKALANQVTLLEQRKSLASSLASFYEGELSVLKETATTEEQKKQVAETAAQIKLRSVREQAELERQILEINIQQKEANLQIEKIKLRSQQIGAAAATKQSEADLASLQAKPGSTPEEIKAARLKVEANKQQEAALQLQQNLLTDQEKLNQQDAVNQRIIQQRNQIVADDKARVELANSRVNENQKTRDLQVIQRDVAVRLGLGGNIEAGLKGLGNTAERTAIPQLNINLPSTIPTSSPQSQIQNQTSQLERAYQSAKQGDINISISNSFQQATQKEATDVTNQIRKQLYDLGTELNRNK